MIDYSRLNKLQIFRTSVNPKELSKVIPYLASKFTRDQFKRMQINLVVFQKFDTIDGIDDLNIDQFKNILPKHIYINAINLDIDELKEAINLFDPAVCSFSQV